jgi:hypothetical protein
MANEVRVLRFAPEQQERAARSFVTRRVPDDAIATVLSGRLRPRSGDLVLARISRLGNHRHIELPTGRRATLHEGDEIILAYADRYATDQYESYVPKTLGRTHFVASGGIASRVATRSGAVRAATEIVPIGLLGDHRGRPINVADYALPRIDLAAVDRPRTVGVFGTAMNAGKTTVIHQLVHGLSRAGARPGATKVTGTGSGNDFWVMLDAGAHRMFDFTDAGMSATFMQPIERLEDAAEQLVAHLSLARCMVNFVEIADGVYQTENQHLIRSPRIHALLDAVVFAASDAMGAAHGVEALRAAGFNVVAVSGTLTRSPLAVRETRNALGLPVLSREDLADASISSALLGIDTADLLLPRDEVALWEVSAPGLIGADGRLWPDGDDLTAPPFAPAANETAEAAIPSLVGVDRDFTAVYGVS